MSDVKKEIAELEQKCKALQLKNTDLETENNRLHQVKMATQRDINNLISELDIKKQAYKEASKSLNTIKTEETYIRNSLKSEEVRLSNLSKQLDIVAKEQAEQSKLLDNQRLSIQKADAESKEIRRAAISRQAQLDGEQARINAKIVNLNKKEDALDNLTAKAQANMDEYNKLKAQVCEEVRKAKELVSKAQDKNADADKRTEALQGIWNQIKSREAKNAEDLALIEQKRKDFAKEVEAVDAKDKSLNKMIAEMATKEKEVEIKRLRIEKLAREKNVDAELKKLEEELKG